MLYYISYKMDIYYIRSYHIVVYYIILYVMAGRQEPAQSRPPLLLPVFACQPEMLSHPCPAQALQMLVLGSL